MTLRPSWTVALGCGLVLLVAAGCTAEAPTPSPYTGLQARTVKALSEADLEAFRTGQGMGLALAAELNQYPGPRHVLELAEALDLSPAQRTETQRLFDAMQAAAITLGEQIIEQETLLDRRFAHAHIDAETLRTLLDEIGALQAELRFVHLDAHLAMRTLLSDEQIARYDELRGYTGEGGGAHEHTPGMQH